MNDLVALLIGSSIHVTAVLTAAWILAFLARRNEKTLHAPWASTSVAILLVPLSLLSPLRPTLRIETPLRPIEAITAPILISPRHRIAVAIASNIEGESLGDAAQSIAKEFLQAMSSDQESRAQPSER
jgi:hypothetical protein